MKSSVKKDRATLIFLTILFILVVVAMIKPVISPTGDTAYLQANVCTNDLDCETGRICCPFYNHVEGVCDLPESCGQILEATQNTKLSELENPKYFDASPIYSVVVALIAAILIISYIFLRTKKE